jgi:hypothetical protein
MSKAKRAVEAIIRLVILAGVMLGADVLAVLLMLAGVSAPGIILAMGACGVAGVILGHRATRPGRMGAGPSRPPPPHGTSAPRNLASRKSEKLG